MKIMCSLLFVVLLCLAGVQSQLTPDVQALVNEMAAMMDTTADPCTDFYQYSCGAFIASHPVPANVSGPYLSVPSIDSISYNNDALLAKIVQDPWPIVNDLYMSCMQPQSSVQDELPSFFIQKVKELDGIYQVKENLWDVIAYVANEGAYAFLMPQANLNDDQTSSISLMAFGNTYQAADYQNETLYNELLEQITQAFEIFESSEQAAQDAETVIAIEEMIANIITDPTQNTQQTVQTLSMATQSDFLGFLTKMGIVAEESTLIDLYSIAYLQNVSALEAIYPPSEKALQRFFEWKIYGTYYFWGYQSNCYNNDDPEDICNSIMGNSPYPAPWDQASFCRNYNVTTSANKYYDNIWSILRTTIPFGLTLTTGPFNRADFEFDPMIVNAFYDPSTNTINFPAGMLEGPMFSGSWPKLFQYSRMGVVVGHENTHGFDNQGSYYTADGLPGDILDNSTRANFLANAECIAEFYSKYLVYGNTYLPGNNTLGENIADIGGVKNSFRAYQAYVAQNGAEFKDYQLFSQLTTNQVYFLHYGQTWCSVQNDAWLEYQLENDVHSPSKFRVLGPLTQFDEFAAAFNCPANSPMNPASRCNLW